MDFKAFQVAVANRLSQMSKYPLFRTATSKEALWSTYLGSFPAGTDPIYKITTEHDCNCCKSFIRAVGNVVAIVDGKIVSIWDIKVNDEYQVVADALSVLVKADAIQDQFYHIEPTAGKDKTLQQLIDKSIKSWNHFFVNIPKNNQASPASIGKLLSDSRSTYQVMSRGLAEITMEAIDTVLELIAQNSIYRGPEFKWSVTEFKKLKTVYDKLPLVEGAGANEDQRTLFVWSQVGVAPEPVARIRGSAIGTLLIDLSGQPAREDSPAIEPLDVDDALNRFEKNVMAPDSYKRPKAEATPAQIQKLRIQIEQAGLMPELSRRYACLDDISINNILHSNNSVKPLLSDNVFDELLSVTVEKVKNFDKVEEVTIEKFLKDILPNAKSVEVMFENRLSPNLVSLVAPANPGGPGLFKWNNGFSWDYNGGMADSDIRAAVQARGGRVDGVLRCSFSWNHDKRNASLMDAHVFMPGHDNPTGHFSGHTAYGNGERVGWNHRRHNRTGGNQDVDYVQAAPAGYVPVENITFPDLSKMPEGTYYYRVHNYQHRTPTQGGFKAEIEFGGEVFQYEYDKPMSYNQWVTVAEITLKGGQFTIKHHLPETTSSRTVWGLQTQTFQEVSVMMLSPNHWDGQVGIGNKHYFFMLKNCVNEGSARGFYNEYLRADLDDHRKALELVGRKMQTAETDNQLSGLGFNDSTPNHAFVRVTGATKRVLKLKF